MGRIIRTAWAFFKLTTPWIGRGAVAAAHLVLITFAALWTGVPTATKRLANDWTSRAMRADVPNSYAPYIYYITGAVGLMVILAGWIILAFLTVLLVRWVM